MSCYYPEITKISEITKILATEWKQTSTTDKSALNFLGTEKITTSNTLTITNIAVT